MAGEGLAGCTGAVLRPGGANAAAEPGCRRGRIVAPRGRAQRLIATIAFASWHPTCLRDLMRGFNRNWVTLCMLIRPGSFRAASRRRFHSRRGRGFRGWRRQVFKMRPGKDIEYPRCFREHGRSASVGSVQALVANVIQVHIRRAAVRRAQFVLCHPHRARGVPPLPSRIRIVIGSGCVTGKSICAPPTRAGRSSVPRPSARERVRAIVIENRSADGKRSEISKEQARAFHPADEGCPRSLAFGDRGQFSPAV